MEKIIQAIVMHASEKKGEISFKEFQHIFKL
jgi:hypothetical protein